MVVAAIIRKRMLDKSVMRKYEKCDNNEGNDEPSEKNIHNNSMLSSIPWRLEITSTDSVADVNEEGTAMSTAGDAATKQEPLEDEATTNNVFLKKSYLDLRRQQNIGWAQDRLVEGIAYSKIKAKQHKAEACYQKGLDVVPNHTDLLTAYGAWLANQGQLLVVGGGTTSTSRTKEALEKLDQALLVDPTHVNAQSYRQAILDRIHNTNINTTTATELTKTKKPSLEHCADRDPTQQLQLTSSDRNYMADSSNALDDSPQLLLSGVVEPMASSTSDSHKDNNADAAKLVAKSGSPARKSSSSPSSETNKYPLLSDHGDDDDDDDDDNNGDGDNGHSRSSSSSDDEDSEDRRRRRKERHRKRKRRRKDNEDKALLLSDDDKDDDDNKDDNSDDDGSVRRSRRRSDDEDSDGRRKRRKERRRKRKRRKKEKKAKKEKKRSRKSLS